jgi:hypothetical protein
MHRQLAELHQPGQFHAQWQRRPVIPFPSVSVIAAATGIARSAPISVRDRNPASRNSRMRQRAVVMHKVACTPALQALTIRWRYRGLCALVTLCVVTTRSVCRQPPYNSVITDLLLSLRINKMTYLGSKVNF